METQAKTPDKQAAKLHLVHQNIEATVMKGHLTSQISSYRCEKYTSVQPYKLRYTMREERIDSKLTQLYSIIH